MSGEGFMQSVKALAAQIDGERDVSEQHIDLLERYLMSMPPEDRAEMRRQMILIVAGISRLEVRMIATDGPLNTAI